MLLLHFFTPKIAHSSYILAGNQTCAVVDPRRDVQVYIDAARSLGVRITHVLETHLHADFISGHLDLADRTGATIYAPQSARCSFDHVAVSEGDEVTLEDMVLHVLETPGHTPEHVSYVVTDTSRGSEPVGVFCGDTLLVGDVGRPDLFPGRAEELAGLLFSSLHDKLMGLPDFCEAYPAHGAGSLCGRAMGAKWQSTIGYERLYNQALLIKDRTEFINSLTTDMPPAPDHFSRCSAINGSGPALVAGLSTPVPLLPAELYAKHRGDGSTVLDVRSYEAFAGQHIPGSYNIDPDTNLPILAGWVLPPDTDIILVAPTAETADEASVWLRRVGLDKVSGFLDGGLPGWCSAGYETASIELLSPARFHDRLLSDHTLEVVDVRTKAEYDDTHIKRAAHMPVADLRTRCSEFAPTSPIALICSDGQRASLGASILKQHGFTSVTNVAGGMTGYLAAGLPTEL
ncbi:MAG: MBL fold metallo-hydrolase [Chloroflexi bacterium]|nr:MBL fold metallo-hydrolase [Chloroflexota bacterium]